MTDLEEIKEIVLKWHPGLNELRLYRSDGNYWPFQFHINDPDVTKFVTFLQQSKSE